jgi:glycosyltransferase involved in cell wall biosynthesis
MKVLMVSTDPVSVAGIGRYTVNLTRALRMLGLDVYVACNEIGKGEFSGLSPDNPDNSDILLNMVDEINPDIIHFQFDPGLYGLRLDARNQRKAYTNIDKFYYKCRISIVTTFHTGYYDLYSYRLAASLIKSSKTEKIGTAIQGLIRFRKYLQNCHAINETINEKVRLSRACIVFSHYMSHMLGPSKCSVIYHGSEPVVCPWQSKKEARRKLSICEDKFILLAFGFRRDCKGWDILKGMNIPNGWTLIISSSQPPDNERVDLTWLNKGAPNKIKLDRHYLTEEDLSLLFYASNAVILPYKVTSGSGVMFDALAHGLPFVSTNLEFFKEFSKQGLGITVKRKPREFSKALEILASKYPEYVETVNLFGQKLKWGSVAQQHAKLYQNVI